MVEFIPLLMFLAVCLVLMAGYPVAASLAGTALLFAAAGSITGILIWLFYKRCQIVYLVPWKILP